MCGFCSHHLMSRWKSLICSQMVFLKKISDQCHCWDSTSLSRRRHFHSWGFKHWECWCFLDPHICDQIFSVMKFNKSTTNSIIFVFSSWQPDQFLMCPPWKIIAHPLWVSLTDTFKQGRCGHNLELQQF